jgi:thiopeptide-type bacteriocin biosynthesis protein
LTEWNSLHIHLHGGVEYTDRFLVDCLAPAADALVGRGGAAGWFFIRYWAGGPHVRLRLRDTAQEDVRLLTEQLDTWLAGNSIDTEPLSPEDFYRARGDIAVHGWHKHGEIVTAEYEPEVERYGGPDAIEIAERLFEESTKVAIAAVRASPGRGRRLGAAMNLVVALAHAVCDSAAMEVAMLRRYVLSARFNTTDASPVDPVAIRVHAEREFGANAETYRATVARTTASLTIEDSGRTSYVRHWAQAAGAYAAQVRSLADAGALTAFGSMWTVLLSQLHMLNNRMGVDIADEYYLCWLVSLVRAGATTGTDFHATGLDTTARRFHEQAKYFASALPEQIPRPVRPRVAPDRPGTALPPPAQFIHSGLAEALAARRSSLGPYGGELRAEEVSALLHHAARDSTVQVGDGSGTVRPYPSAGALLATKVYVLPARVAGIDPAIYEYVPTRHELRTVAPGPDTDRLAALSPYLDPGAPISVDVRTVPLWLFLTGDITRVTERYGLRGYRFLLLEVGHLAQNLALTATGLGMRSAPIGAFYDDAVAQLLDLDAVTESPFYLMPVGHA